LGRAPLLPDGSLCVRCLSIGHLRKNCTNRIHCLFCSALGHIKVNRFELISGKKCSPSNVPRKVWMPKGRNFPPLGSPTRPIFEQRIPWVYLDPVGVDCPLDTARKARSSPPAHDMEG
jgi:hypothetical protein